MIGYSLGPNFRAHFYIYERQLYVSWTWDAWQSGQAKQVSRHEFKEARSAVQARDMTKFQEVVE
jgi:hypothetical protein